MSKVRFTSESPNIKLKLVERMIVFDPQILEGFLKRGQQKECHIIIFPKMVISLFIYP